MKLNNYTSILGILLFICLLSCKPSIDSKDSYLIEYKSFVEEIKDHKDDYTQAEWEEKDEEFKKFSDELYQKYSDELGFMEQARIAKYAIIYGSTRGVNALNKALEYEEIEETMEELKELWNNDLKDDFESIITDIKKVWDEDLRDELEGKLSELKEVLEDEDFQEEITKKVDEIKKIVEDKELEDDFKEVMEKVEKMLNSIEEKQQR